MSLAGPFAECLGARWTPGPRRCRRRHRRRPGKRALRPGSRRALAQRGRRRYPVQRDLEGWREAFRVEGQCVARRACRGWPGAAARWRGDAGPPSRTPAPLARDARVAAAGPRRPRADGHRRLGVREPDLQARRAAPGIAGVGGPGHGEPGRGGGQHRPRGSATGRRGASREPGGRGRGPGARGAARPRGSRRVPGRRLLPRRAGTPRGGGAGSAERPRGAAAGPARGPRGHCHGPAGGDSVPGAPRWRSHLRARPCPQRRGPHHRGRGRGGRRAATPRGSTARPAPRPRWHRRTRGPGRARHAEHRRPSAGAGERVWRHRPGGVRAQRRRRPVPRLPRGAGRG